MFHVPAGLEPTFELGVVEEQHPLGILGDHAGRQREVPGLPLIAREGRWRVLQECAEALQVRAFVGMLRRVAFEFVEDLGALHARIVPRGVGGAMAAPPLRWAQDSGSAFLAMPAPKQGGGLFG